MSAASVRLSDPKNIHTSKKVLSSMTKYGRTKIDHTSKIVQFQTLRDTNNDGLVLHNVNVSSVVQSLSSIASLLNRAIYPSARRGGFDGIRGLWLH